MEYSNLYLILIIIGITIFGYNKLKEKKVIESKEHFYVFGSLIKAMNGIAEFFVNFPDLFMVMVDAMINFFLSFVDIFISLFSALEWIINIPMWVINGVFYVISILADILLLMILYLNPITLMKGIVKMIFFLVKIIIVFFIDIIKNLLKGIIDYFLNQFRDGLWGIPHGPDKHAEHDGELPVNEDKLGAFVHHHDNHDMIDGPIYKPLRCYKGIGANGYLNIIAIIICPPLGVFMSYGLSGWLKILISAGLSLFYYFPGLVYALLVTTHLGLGQDIDTHDCGGVVGGYFVHGCEKRLTKEQCNDAKIPFYKDKNKDAIKACIWKPDSNIPEGGTCQSKWFKGDNYSDLMSGNYHPERGEPGDPAFQDDHGYTKGDVELDAMY